MASNIPGFANFQEPKLSDLTQGNAKRSYEVRIVKKMDQLQQEVFKMVQEMPQYAMIASTSDRKKTEEDYLVNYNQHLDLVREIIQKNGYGVYRSEEGKKSEHIPLEELARTITSAFIGFDCLEDAKSDPEVTDIYCISWNEIHVEKAGENMPYWKHFASERAYNNFVDRLLREDNKQIDTGEHKLVDAEVFGVRLNAVHSSVATKGIALTIRKHAETPITLEDMVEQGMLSKEMAEMFKILVQGGVNGCVEGITGSGKTTFLKAMFEAALGSTNKNVDERIRRRRAITIEDTPELFLSLEHCLPMHTYNSSDPKVAIDQRDLIISVLRMKPYYILVSEVRGIEAASFIEAATTGHSSWTTIHADNSWDAIHRFVDKYGLSMPNLSSHAVERIIATSVDFIFTIDNIPDVGRRVTEVDELSFNHAKDRIEIKEIVRYHDEKGFVWKNTLGEETIDTMLRRGIKRKTIETLQNYIKSQIQE